MEMKKFINDCKEYTLNFYIEFKEVDFTDKVAMLFFAFFNISKILILLGFLIFCIVLITKCIINNNWWETTILSGILLGLFVIFCVISYYHKRQ